MLDVEVILNLVGFQIMVHYEMHRLGHEVFPPDVACQEPSNAHDSPSVVEATFGDSGRFSIL